MEAIPAMPIVSRILRIFAFVDLAVLVILGIICSIGNMGLEQFKTVAIILSLIYFVSNGISMVLIYRADNITDEVAVDNEDDLEKVS
jgi:multisubunit Na+/H+ antiporter MnhG subunit